MQGGDKGQWEQTETQQILIKYKKKNLWEGGETLAQIAWGGYGVSTLGDIQSPTGHGPGQPAVADPALSKGVGLNDLQRCLSASAVLCCYE